MQEVDAVYSKTALMHPCAERPGDGAYQTSVGEGGAHQVNWRSQGNWALPGTWSSGALPSALL